MFVAPPYRRPPTSTRVAYTPRPGSTFRGDGSRFAVGTPIVRPRPLPGTTRPGRRYQRPRRRAASSTSPSRSALRIRLLLTGSPDARTAGTRCTGTSCARPQASRLAAVPSRRWPKVYEEPATISQAPSRPRRMPSSHTWAGMRENARSNGTTIVASAPSCSMRARRSSTVVSRTGSAPGRSTSRGCGSKVTTTALPPTARARATACLLTCWCPRWTPSNVPRASTGQALPGRGSSRPNAVRNVPPLGTRQHLEWAEEPALHASQRQERPAPAAEADRRILRRRGAHLPDRHGVAVQHVGDAAVREVHRGQVADGLVHRAERVRERPTGGEVFQLLERQGIGELEPARPGPHHEVGVPAHPERVADVRAQLSDVRPLAADDVEQDARPLPVGPHHVDAVHHDAARLQVHDLAAPRQAIQPGPLVVDRGDHRRHLQDLPGEPAEDGLEGRPGDRAGGTGRPGAGCTIHRTQQGARREPRVPLRQDLAVGVAGAGPDPQAHLDAVGLVRLHQELAEARRPPDAADQHARSTGVERAGMADPSEPDEAADDG